MPAARLSAREQLDLAIDDLVRVGARLPQVDIVPGDADRVEVRGDGGVRAATVVAYEAVGEAQAGRLIAGAAGGDHIVVANRISEPARRLLAAAGWSWLDRRLGAHLALDGRDVDVVLPVEPLPDGQPARAVTPAAEGPIRGRAGLAYAAALLCHPNRPPAFRAVARAVGMSPTAISNAVAHLAEAGLVGPGNEPTLPELFWTLATVWGPTKVVPVATRPEPTKADVADLDGPGRVLGGDLAAVELGAPLFTPDGAPWVQVPTIVELRRAERRFGSSTWGDRAGVIAVPATPLVCQGRWRAPADGTGWPLPHPVFAALDLAGDPGRGREILDRWTPEGAEAVWR